MSDHIATLLRKLNQNLPRYTSYPTAPSWKPMTHNDFCCEFIPKEGTLSLYFHIPFCEKMCLFCGCSVVLNRKKENEIFYRDRLIEEMEMKARLLPHPLPVNQIHFGGGTPTKLDNDLLASLFFKIKELFWINEGAEISIEVDPRTLYHQSNRLGFLRELGFNRISFGVQDMDPKVQKAIGRNQSPEMTWATYEQARRVGFNEINLDLIYGLPFQTRIGFEKTVEAIIRMAPDQIALFGYAKIPHLKPHQKAIPESTLPTLDEKFAIYTMARSQFKEAGYVAIGMDHFAKKESKLALSYRSHTLHRNFQGYSPKHFDYLIGFGLTAISDLKVGFFQNEKTLDAYYKAIENEHLPLFRGLILSNEDKLRKWVIHHIMCHMRVDKQLFKKIFECDFDLYFENRREELLAFEREGLIVNDPHTVQLTELGELFARNIASLFDGYLQGNTTTYSASI